MENTFTTPVFNGSTSLRDAAGQLIEDVTKSVRRKQEVNDESMEELFDEVTSLYHLNESSASSTGKQDLGPMPRTSIILLTALAAAWGSDHCLRPFPEIEEKIESKHC